MAQSPRAFAWCYRHIFAGHLSHEAICVPRGPSRWSSRHYTPTPKRTSPQVGNKHHSLFISYQIHARSCSLTPHFLPPHLHFRESRPRYQHDDHTEAFNGGRGLVPGPAHRWQDGAQVLIPLRVRWALLRGRMLGVLPAERRRLRPLHLWRARGDCVRRRVEGTVLHWTWVTNLCYYISTCMWACVDVCVSCFKE